VVEELDLGVRAQPLQRRTIGVLIGVEKLRLESSRVGLGHSARLVPPALSLWMNRFEPEHRKASGQRLEFVRRAVHDESAAFGEPDADGHLDRERP